MKNKNKKSQWFNENKTNEHEIDRPYYRIVNGIYGSSGKFSDNPLNSSVGTGSYWTPRWDAIQLMFSSTLKFYRKFMEEGFYNTTVYQVDKAIMEDAPEDHKWAFNYTSDAGEKVLVKALEPIKIAVDPKSGKKLENISPESPLFISICIESLTKKPPVDFRRNGIESIYKNQIVYVIWDYNDYLIKLVKPDQRDNWKYQVVDVAYNIQSWDEIYKQLKFTHDSDLIDGLEWFFMDADQAARQGDHKARGWLMPGVEFGQHKENI